MSFISKLCRRFKAVRVVWWVCTDKEEATEVYQRICKVDDVTVTGVLAELAECTKVPPDRLADLRANTPDGVEVIGEHEPGNGPWYSAAILVPLSQMGPFRPWYSGGKYRHDLDDIWLNQVAEYPIDCDLRFSRFYLANTQVLESFDVSANSGVETQSPTKTGLSDAKCNLCGKGIKYGEPILRHPSRRDLVVCKSCTMKGVRSGKLPKEAAELEPYDD